MQFGSCSAGFETSHTLIVPSELDEVWRLGGYISQKESGEVDVGENSRRADRQETK